MTELSWLTERPIAHRGFHDLNKNVLGEHAFGLRGAPSSKAIAIECDVHLSRDGVPVDLPRQRSEAADRHATASSGSARPPRLQALRIGGTEDHAPTLAEMLDLVDGRVPLVIELKGIPGHDDGLVASGRASMLQRLCGQGGDHVVRPLADPRSFRQHAPDIPAGLTAYGDRQHEIRGAFLDARPRHRLRVLRASATCPTRSSPSCASG